MADISYHKGTCPAPYCALAKGHEAGHRVILTRCPSRNLRCECAEHAALRARAEAVLNT